ncbi:phosphotransferase enzyme family protein [Alkaliphilus hydrothermalis]|uniref:Ser/Thr protein kinase RdoA (MazF antagonist) n=1 Tax=Alkaliphilus hydrothermalis TaxID=1482730 RepID=A0ABS2NLH0_9FIRM|nr:phosphotransferase [Alkaliphilus hydrothermalis]MBM7613790.1 Ser/Thr protein kinase RdoA (MazF antagonist) [Alkaliphilus hydrothermalis]
MLKLKHLFSNIDLATMIVSNWEYDDLEPLQYWNISSNAIYPFKNKEEMYFLRFAPNDEKHKDNIEAELEFLLYLQNQGYSAIQPKTSKQGRLIEVVDTPWGQYYASVFNRVKGDCLGRVELTEKMITLWGKALGNLHLLSSGYNPTGGKRRSWEDHLEWIKNVLSEFPNQEKPLEEVQILETYFKNLPITNDNYGLIHYDFELDNVFFDKETKEITPIDFDDSMYHWYGMDLERAINSIKDELEPDKVEEAIKSFLEGYQSVKPLSEETLDQLHVFQRFGNLYGYTRVLRSINEKWENEPEWMVNLRGKLEGVLERRSEQFSMPLIK